jgi:four helix bundle protein
MADFTRFHVWHEAVALGAAVHDFAATLPVTRCPGLAGQLRRAAAGVGACIAEGASRPGGREFARFLQMAIGSCGEVEHHLRYALALRVGTAAECEALQRRASILRRRLIALRSTVLRKSQR